DGIIFLLNESGVLYAYNFGEKISEIYEVNLTKEEDLLVDRHWFVELNQTAYLAIALKDGGVLLHNLVTLETTVLLGCQKHITITTLNAGWNSQILWVGTDEGSIFKIDLNKNFQVQSMDSHFPELLSNHVKIWTINQSSEDILWIGTDGGGVYRYMPKGKPFYNIIKGDGQGGGISHNIVRAIIKDKEGTLWVGTRGDGLNMIPSDGGKTQYYNVLNGLSNNAVISLEFDDNRNLWIGVDGEGIDMLERSTGKVLHFPEDFINDVDLGFGSVYSICVDVYGSIWLGTSGYGLINFEISKTDNGHYYLSDYKQIKYAHGEKGLKSDIVYSIVEEQPNVLWVGTRRGGLHRLNTLNGKIEIYRNRGKNGLSNDDILSLYIGSGDKLWIGTSGGLNMINLSYKPYQFKHYTEYDGLPNNTVHGILEDVENNIWLSTNRGLSKYLTLENRFINFNNTDGLQNNEYTDGAVYSDTLRHFLYFGGVDGIDWFDPQCIKQANHFPPIVFNELRLYNNLIVPGDTTHILQTGLNSTNRIELNHNQNFFSLSFSTLNYYNSAKCKFSYYLEGFDHDWNSIQTNRTANFTTVPPGLYTFKVRASNEDGVFGQEMKEIVIDIKPPFGQTLFAYILYGLALLGIINLYFLYHKRRMKQKSQRELELLNRQKKDEINQYKLQFFTNIAHEFRTPLTLILAPAVTLMNYIKEDERLAVYARTIYQNANRLQHLIQELIEFRKVETGNMRLKIRQHELVEYIGELIHAFEFFANQNEIELSFVYSSPKVEAWVDIKNLEKILLNLISNAIKYTPKGGNVEVNIELCNNELC
nr:triple tyrosine motif-containing protein [Bacteroidales bacterium]